MFMNKVFKSCKKLMKAGMNRLDVFSILNLNLETDVVIQYMLVR